MKPISLDSQLIALSIHTKIMSNRSNSTEISTKFHILTLFSHFGKKGGSNEGFMENGHHHLERENTKKSTAS